MYFILGLIVLYILYSLNEKDLLVFSAFILLLILLYMPNTKTRFCLNCGGKYTSKNHWQKFCSDGCRIEDSLQLRYQKRERKGE